MALAATTGRPVIFVSTPFEAQIVNDCKEKEGGNVVFNLRNWCRAVEGKGIVQEFEGMRWTGFAHQFFELSQVCPKWLQKAKNAYLIG